jgi:Ca-activated chloride channel homolog
MYLTFTNPKYLSLLLILPIFILIHFISLHSSKKKALKFANFEAISRVKGVDILSKNLTSSFLIIMLFVILVLAVAGLTFHTQRSASSFSFVLAIDASKSMEASDFQPSRIDAAKQLAKEFVDSSPSSTKIGVISFSGNSFIHQAVTSNKELVKSAIDSVEIGTVEGTDIYETLITSSNLLMGEDAKAIILLSDGQVNVGNIDQAIEYANSQDITIDSIAIGTLGGGQTAFGTSKLNEDTLKAISYNTEGEFFNAQDSSQLKTAFNNLLQLTEKKVSVNLSPLLIIIAMALAFLEYILFNFRFRVFP